MTRATRWGNPHRVAGGGCCRDQAVEDYERDLCDGLLGVTVDDVRRELAGHDLACWCPLDQPCHADVLLRLANEEVAP